MTPLITISYIAAVVCGGLALCVACLKRTSWPWLLFAFGSFLFAIDSACIGRLLDASSDADVFFWYRMKLATLGFIPGVWLAVSLSYSRGNYREFIRRWRVALWAGLIVPILLILVLHPALAAKVYYTDQGHIDLITLNSVGKLVHGYLLLTSIVVLMNFERTFRSAVGVMRWRIKYFILGVALFFGAQIYGSSQALLYSGVHGLSIEIKALALFVSTMLISFSFLRTRLGESEIYPSHKVLHQSLTFALAIAYLVCVGIFANLVTYLGGDSGFPVKSLLLMVGIVGMTVVLVSDRVRQQIGVFVSRNFHRPTHDYRKIWSLFSDRTGSLVDRTAFCRAAVTLVSETFEVLSVTLWIVDEREKSLTFGASTALTEQRAGSLLLNESQLTELLSEARQWSGPIDLDSSRESSVRIFRQLAPEEFHLGGSRVCVPLLFGGGLLGFVTAGDRVNGRPFTVEDLDLLKRLGDEIAGRLRNIEISRQLLQNKQMEAFQTMSAFFVHDLKNTASTLSLMLQNLSLHFGDPVFREDCERSLSRSVTHIQNLISRLALLRHELKLQKIPTDLNQLISSTLEDLGEMQGVEISKDLGKVPLVPIDPEQVQKVIANLVINAREAVNGSGKIRLQTSSLNRSVSVTVTDNGTGMTQEFVRKSLFKPFQTTKKNGLGIGMFHTKAIVEAHQGRIEVESEAGKGTTFRVLFPVNE